MKKETEIKIYEIAFGDNARPEELNDLPDDTRRMTFTEDDLIEQLEECSKAFHILEEMDPSDRAMLLPDEDNEE